MKTIIFLVMSIFLSASPISNYFINFFFINSQSEMCLHKNHCHVYTDTNNSQQFDWRNADLQNFKFKTDTQKDVNKWTYSDLVNHDLNINYIEFRNGTGFNLRQKIYIAIANAFDNRYKNYELTQLHDVGILLDQAKDYGVLKQSFFITIMSKSINSNQVINNNVQSFLEFNDIESNEIQSFYLRISNHASMDWNINKSYFDVSLNICYFDTDTSQTLASKTDNLNVNCLPTTSVTSSRKFNSTDFGVQTVESRVNYVIDNWSGLRTYDLHRYNSTKLHFSGSYADIDIIDAAPKWKNVSWDSGGFDDHNQSGQISATKFSQNFNNISDIYKYVKSISITSDCSLEDWCFPNWNSHTQTASNQTVTWNNDGNNLPSYDFVVNNNDHNYFWNRKPDSIVKSAWEYIPDTQYDKQFGYGAHLFMAGFMFFCQSPVNNTDIDVFAMFNAQLDYVAQAGIQLKFLVHSTRITFNFDHTPFDNITLP